MLEYSFREQEWFNVKYIAISKGKSYSVCSPSKSNLFLAYECFSNDGAADVESILNCTHIQPTPSQRRFTRHVLLYMFVRSVAACRSQLLLRHRMDLGQSSLTVAVQKWHMQIVYNMVLYFHFLFLILYQQTAGIYNLPIYVQQLSCK